MSERLYVQLDPTERKELTQITHAGMVKARVFRRATILLMADRRQRKFKTQAEIVEATGASTATISQVCRRYVRDGLVTALGEKPRPGARPKVTGEVEATLVMLACSKPPEERVCWTLSLLRDELIKLEVIESLSTTAVRKTLKKMNLSLGKSGNGAFPKRRRAL